MNVGVVGAPITSCTGYGKVAKEICYGLADIGYGVINIGGRGTSLALGEKIIAWTEKGNPIHVLPCWGQTGDKETIEHFIRRYGLDAIISIYDAYVMSFGKPSKPLAIQIPIDTELNHHWVNYMTNADYIVAMSQFARKELLRFFPDFMVKQISHGVDLSIFRPRSEEEKVELRRKWSIPEDKCVILSVAANWGERKNLPQLMITFKRLLESYKDAMLYLYTNLKENTPQGYRLDIFAELLGIQDHILGPQFNPILDSVEDEALAELYAVCDVLCVPSLGEGFGLPIIEAMACGTPVIGTNSSSINELIKGHGWLVDTVPRDIWEDVPVWIPLLARYPVPNLQSLLMCMSEACMNHEKRQRYGRASVKFALQYSWDKVLSEWDALLREMVKEK